MTCPGCSEPLLDGEEIDERGRLAADGTIATLRWHRECLIREDFGSVGHLLKRCPCYGGTEEDPPGMTDREAARAAADTLERLWQTWRQRRRP